MINEKIGTNYHLFDYYGSPEAKTVMIAMGSVCDAAEEVVDYINAKKGDQVGLIKVRLYRPLLHRAFPFPASRHLPEHRGHGPLQGRPAPPANRCTLDVVRALKRQRLRRRARCRRPLRLGLQGHHPRRHPGGL